MASPKIYPSTVNTGNFIVGSLTSVDIVAKEVPDDKGNVMIAAMVIVGVLFDPGTIIPPNNWQEIQQNTTSTGGMTRVAVFTKLVEEGETGTYTFTWNNASSIGFWLFAEYGGGDTDRALDGYGAGQRNALGVGSIAPSVTPEGCNLYNTLVCIWASDLKIGNVMSMNPPNNMTLQVQSGSLATGFPSLMLCDQELTSNDPTGECLATAAFATTSLGISFLVKQSIWAGAAPIGSSGGM